ncbi:MAG: diguanylate cyclase [Gammaproteobacteria bacterium]|nr:diguanylate cyclase [Gammaproteobacteria bacterium]
MTIRNQRLSTPSGDRVRQGVGAGRLASILMAVTGIGIVYLYPGSIPVVLSVAIALAVGLYFTTGSAASDRAGVPQKILEEHRLLVESIESAPIPFAVYDQDDYLIVCNESYEELYGDAFDKLRSRGGDRRIHYADLVRAFNAGSMNAGELDDYVAERCRAQRSADGTAVDRLYSGFGWLRVTKFATPAGAVAGFAVDVNELKDREAALQAQIEKSRLLEDRLRQLANTDHLTGLANRRRFLECLEAEFARANRFEAPLSVVMMDIDRFKAINDVHGHGYGDEVIDRVAGAAAGQLREHVDLIGRLGGEEFGILLPSTGEDGALECAKRICSAVAALEFESGGATIRVTASFGIAGILASDRLHSECIARADNALYQAKTAGRNRVVVWREDAPCAG